MDKTPKWQDLPCEIIYNILVNLPVKTLTRFHCVCKSWNSLISDFSFQQEHYRHQLQTNLMLLIASLHPGDSSDSDDSENDFENLVLSTHKADDGSFIHGFSIKFPVPPSTPFCGAIQNCQGLVCVSLCSDIYVCNPATKKIIALPDTGDKINYCIGFGYATSTKEFKVVRFFRHLYSSTKNYCEIFTLGTREWREARCPPPDSFYDLGSHAPFLHGAIHFLSDSKEHKVDDAIYVFHFESEEYTTIRFPEDYYVALAVVSESSPSGTIQCLNELRGCLCLTSNFEDSMHIWLLKDYDSGKWVKEYIINLSEWNPQYVNGVPLAIMGNGTILLKIFENFGNMELFLYNPDDKTFMYIDGFTATATMYAESLLVCPGCEALLMN